MRITNICFQIFYLFVFVTLFPATFLKLSFDVVPSPTDCAAFGISYVPPEIIEEQKVCQLYHFLCSHQHMNVIAVLQCKQWLSQILCVVYLRCFVSILTKFDELKQTVDKQLTPSNVTSKHTILPRHNFLTI